MCFLMSFLEINYNYAVLNHLGQEIKMTIYFDYLKALEYQKENYRYDVFITLIFLVQSIHSL